MELGIRKRLIIINNIFTFTVPCLFGLEAIVGDELRFMGMSNVEVFDGKVLFKGDYNSLARANIRLRCGERVLLNVGDFMAFSYDELFEKVKALPWENFIGKLDAFPIKGYSLKSKLFSVPDLQSIIKKSIAERLKQKYNVNWLEETGAKKQIQFSLMKDTLTIMLDTSGIGLHKRGYRAVSNEAPLRETLASAIISISRFKNGETLVDPFCGSGTIPIEAALYATKTAPGLMRSFSAEAFEEISKGVWKNERDEAKALIKKPEIQIFASDIDLSSVELTKENAKKAGIGTYITTTQSDVRDLEQIKDTKGVVICNPPYGERMMEQKEAEELYADMGKVFNNFKDYRYYILTSHEDFERQFGKRADKNRKLYNGMLKCYLFQYFK